MSRIGKIPVNIPEGVQIAISDENEIAVKGPKGELKQKVDRDIILKTESGVLSVARPSDLKRHKAMQGLYRSLIQNMVVGVTQGYRIQQELVGVGYRASSQGQLLDLVLGYSHHFIFQIPVEIKVSTLNEKGQNPKIILEGTDKQLIGQIAAKIRSLRPPEPYKGKGIKFTGEQLRRKQGKQKGKK